MRIFRGPKTKDFGDESVTKVDEIDLSTDSRPWFGKSNRVEVNITKKGSKRKSVVYLDIGATDVLGLLQGLVKRW